MFMNRLLHTSTTLQLNQILLYVPACYALIHGQHCLQQLLHLPLTQLLFIAVLSVIVEGDTIRYRLYLENMREKMSAGELVDYGVVDLGFEGGREVRGQLLVALGAGQLGQRAGGADAGDRRVKKQWVLVGEGAVLTIFRSTLNTFTAFDTLIALTSLATLDCNVLLEPPKLLDPRTVPQHPPEHPHVHPQVRRHRLQHPRRIQVREHSLGLELHAHRPPPEHIPSPVHSLKLRIHYDRPLLVAVHIGQLREVLAGRGVGGRVGEHPAGLAGPSVGVAVSVRQQLLVDALELALQGSRGERALGGALGEDLHDQDLPGVQGEEGVLEAGVKVLAVVQGQGLGERGDQLQCWCQHGYQYLQSCPSRIILLSTLTNIYMLPRTPRDSYGYLPFEKLLRNYWPAAHINPSINKHKAMSSTCAQSAIAQLNVVGPAQAGENKVDLNKKMKVVRRVNVGEKENMGGNEGNLDVGTVGWQAKEGQRQEDREEGTGSWSAGETGLCLRAKEEVQEKVQEKMQHEGLNEGEIEEEAMKQPKDEANQSSEDEQPVITAQEPIVTTQLSEDTPLSALQHQPIMTSTPSQPCPQLPTQSPSSEPCLVSQSAQPAAPIKTKLSLRLLRRKLQHHTLQQVAQDVAEHRKIELMGADCRHDDRQSIIQALLSMMKSALIN